MVDIVYKSPARTDLTFNDRLNAAAEVFGGSGYGEGRGQPDPVKKVEQKKEENKKSNPVKSSKASDIKTQVKKVTKEILPKYTKKDSGQIMTTMMQTLMQGIPQGGSTAAQQPENNTFISLRVEMTKLFSYFLSGDKEAFNTQFSYIANTFPLANINFILSIMLYDALVLENPDVTRNKIPNIMIPVPGQGNKGIQATNSNQALGQLLNMVGQMMGGMVKTPTKQAEQVKPTKAAPERSKSVEKKNLAADDSAQNQMGNMQMPLSQFMSMMGTMQPTNNLNNQNSSPSISPQKQSTIANTVNWGSNPYPRNNENDAIITQQLDILSQLEDLSVQLGTLADTSPLFSMSYQELITKYPQITQATTVGQALDIMAGRINPVIN